MKKAVKVVVTGMVVMAVFGAGRFASDTTYEAKAEIRWADNGTYVAVCKGNGFDVDGVMFEFYGDGYKANDRVVVTFDSKGTQSYADDEIVGVTREN